MMRRPHILIAVGARPNFMKAAPILRALRATGRVRLTLVHTGQHYDEELSSCFFRDLKLPAPDVNLKIGSLSRDLQVQGIARRFEKELARLKPDLVVVVGDVNSTLGCALGASRTFYPRGTLARPWRHRPLLAHVEAGLRSFDLTMPEEVNRIGTDHLSDLLFAPSLDAVAHLQAEGIPDRKIFFVGNVMIDSLRYALDHDQSPSILKRFKVTRGRYAVVTLHRPSNVDDPTNARRMCRVLQELQKLLPVIFPIHPRTQLRFQRSALLNRLRAAGNLILTEPLGYQDFVKLMACARVVLTDSGGVQEETTFLKVPCLTLLENTERSVTLTHGTNRLVGTNPERILAACRSVLNGSRMRARVPSRWDGRTAQRITRVLLSRL